ncbi:hypothetical protein BpHYR1_052422, partial [Brachionus plicatilis]
MIFNYGREIYNYESGSVTNKGGFKNFIDKKTYKCLMSTFFDVNEADTLCNTISLQLNKTENTNLSIQHCHNNQIFKLLKKIRNVSPSLTGCPIYFIQYFATILFENFKNSHTISRNFFSQPFTSEGTFKIDFGELLIRDFFNSLDLGVVGKDLSRERTWVFGIVER